MLPKMRYRLGLDLGSTSIGWCMVRLDKTEQPVAVIKMGARIFSDGRNPKDGSSLAVTRRNARQARRRRDRLLKRKSQMLNVLVDLGFFPSDEKERQKLTSLNPYALRKKGLYEPLTGEEFARALFHINQRRGFKSNRKTDRKDNENGILKSAIGQLKQKLEQENCQTLGEWLANRHEQGLSVRARLRGKTKKDKAYDFYADRSMVEHEFDMLWQAQQKFNPELFHDASRDKLKDILLFQRPLKPVKPGRCTLLSDEERAPRALPSQQLFRIYQEVNNLRILDDNLVETPLTIQQRDQVVGLLEQGKGTFRQIRSELGLSGTTKFNLEDVKRDHLKVNATTKVLSKKEFFGKAWHDFSLNTQDQIVEQILNEPSEQKIIDWLQQSTGVDEITAEKIANVSLPEGYGNLSKKALDRILPELTRDVLVYSQAVERAGFDSHSILSHAGQTGEIMEVLPYYGQVLQRHVGFGSNDNNDNPDICYGRIANPTVHIGLNQLRRVVNAIIRKYGHPSEIVVEVARELKLSREKKRDLEKEQAKRQERNKSLVEEACKALGLNPDTIDRAKRRELSQRLQLWEELNPKDAVNRKCPYSGEQISITRLLSNEVEIEHILPYSRTLDDSMNNKTVSMRRANKEKGNLTPFEAFGEQQVEGYDYEQILNRVQSMPSAKKKRFAKEGYVQWLQNENGFIARALNDTAYFSRIAKEYLTCICPENKVTAIPGRMTALLRGKFGLNQLLSGTEFKNRDDHRHHALDAAVIAVTDRSLLQRFAKASASAREKQLNKLVEQMPVPWLSYREHVERALKSIIVSHKPDHSYQGAMHEDTAWGLRENGMTSRLIQLESSELRQRVDKKQNLIQFNSTNNQLRHGFDKDGQPKNYKGYKGGSNYCIEIVEDEKGKWSGEVISTYQAYQVIRELGEEKGYQRLRHATLSQSNKPLVMRLMSGDMVMIHIEGEKHLFRLVKINGSNGCMTFSEHFEANVDNRSREKTYQYLTKYAGSLKKTGGRQVLVSELGTIRYPSIKI